ncbi:MAG: PD-(D/E)XK nuclease family protein [Coriobacteriia bacterium]|nr:PD-(D/E)XK nuclease family protein [Coriobacteriia bacterium]MCL2537135.1 PD-(D/E)XK nuclease family protein [Coriobacteriia bacterium]
MNKSSTAKSYSIHQISASDVSAFHTCPRKFYLDKVLRLGELHDVAPTRATNRGSLIHLLLEWGSVEQAPALFARNQVSEEQGREMIAVVESFQTSEVYQRLLSGQLFVREHAFYLQLSKAGEVPRYLKGYIDALSWESDTELLIVDYKTGTSKKTLADYQTQADCYGYAGLCMGAEQVQVLMVRPEVIVDGQPEIFEFDYTTADREPLRTGLLTTIESMESADVADLSAVAEKTCAYCVIVPNLCPKRS